MKKNKNRVYAILLCLITVFALFPMQVSAVPVDKERECRLEIAFAPEGIKASGVKFKAYKVASFNELYKFEAEPRFAEQSITKLLENPSAENYSLMASTLAGVIASDGRINPDFTSVLDASGTALFENLQPALYLIMGEVYKGKDYFYVPSNFMIALPEADSKGLWNYDVFAEVKWEKRSKDDSLNLSVLKIWSDSATNLHENDNVTVQLYKNGVLYDTRMLNKNNNWNYKWSNLYGGDSWAVKEKDMEGYMGTVERKEDCFVITNTLKKTVTDYVPIPQTGLLKWPVPVLIICGILFVLTGIRLKRKGEKFER